ncbi:unnamed protein product [Blepharisma stoltei]|uniref:Uncharacterized protein n=1 Tax=Blepharisma stoltei TaxID=1481888 RepID=A0AAU9JVU1_9CILI|nr:unnamed protein product [Blepharisma stoltei]
MGNSLSDILSRVDSLDLDRISKTLKDDLAFISNPSIIFDIDSLLSRSDLDVYQAPGLDKTKPKEDDVTTDQEESMILSLDNPDRFHEKHADAIKNLIEDILRKRTEDSSTKEIIKKFQAISKSFESLLRIEQFNKLRGKNEEKKEKIKKTAISDKAEIAISAGLRTIVMIIETVKEIKPELHERLIQQACEILKEIPPLSLQSNEPAIVNSLTVITQFFDSILRNERKTNFVPLLSLCIASGNLNTILALVVSLFVVRQVDREVLEAIFPLLKIFKDFGALSPKWSIDKCGPESNIEDYGTAVSGESGWSTVLGEDEFRSGIHYFEAIIEKLSTENLMLGVADAKYNSLTCWAENSFTTISYQADSTIWLKSTEIYKWEKWSIGDKIGMLLDMNEKTVTFYKNGIKEPQEKHKPLPDVVKIYTSQSGVSKIRLVNPEDYPEEVAKLLGIEKHVDSNLFKENKLFKIFGNEEINDEYLGVTSGDILTFILNKLANANENVLNFLQSENKACTQPKKKGISIDLRCSTLDQLDLIFEKILIIAKKNEFSKLNLENCHSCFISLQKIIRAHLLISEFHSENDLTSLIKKRIFDHSTELILLLPNTKSSEEASSTISLCFDIFYGDPKEKLLFMVTRLENRKKNKEDNEGLIKLQDKIFSEMKKPEKLFSALELVGEDQEILIRKFIDLLIEFAAQESIKAIQGKQYDISLIKLLETAQTAIFSQAAKSIFSSKWLGILSLYSLSFFKATSEIIKTILELYPNGEIPDEFYIKSKDTMINQTLEIFLHLLMVTKSDINFLSKILSEIQTLIWTLHRFPAKPPILNTEPKAFSQIFESEHNYKDNMNTEYLIQFPRAKKYTLIFDPQCKTENSCDYLELWTEKEKLNKLAKWTGTDWPKEPFEVKNPLLFFTFHSDGSQNDYGWKIEIKSYIEARYTEVWPTGIMQAVNVLMGIIASNLVSGEYDNKPENEEIVKLLANPMLKYGISDNALAIIKDPSPVNQDLITLATNKSLVKKAKRALTLSGYPEVIKNRIIKSKSSAITLGDYIASYQKIQKNPSFSNIQFLQELIDGSDRVKAAWTNLKKKSGIFGPSTNTGGSEMDQAERAIFAVYIAFFDVIDTVNKIFDSPEEVGLTLKFIIKQSNLIRGWAQKHKQQLMDHGNPDITYTDINRDIVIKSALLLAGEYRFSLNELGVNKVMKNLLSSVAKMQTKNSLPLKTASKWKAVKKAVITSSKLKGLLTTASKIKQPENEDIKEFLKVADFVTKFLESSISLQEIMETIEKRRTKGIARVLGLLLFSDLIKNSNKNETAIVKIFSDSLKKKGEKHHCWDGLEGIDPFLLKCVQHSFFEVYETLQKELKKNDDNKNKISDYEYYLSVIEAMSYPLKGIDGDLILEKQFSMTISHLLKWAKGNFGEDEIVKPFKKELCITRLGILIENEVPENSEKILLEEKRDENNLYLVIDKGGNAQPIVEILLESHLINGYEKATEDFVFKGERKYILIKRDSEKPNQKYLTGISNNLEFSFTNYEDLLSPELDIDTKTRESLKLKLSKSSWGLFKQILYSIVGSWVEPNESTKNLIQEIFIKVLFDEFKFDKIFMAQNTDQFIISQIVKGENWIGKNIISSELVKNPVKEWIRQFKKETENFEGFYLCEIIDDFINKADPAMKGIIHQNDLIRLDSSIVDTLECYEENKNSKGEYDFFRYLNVFKNFSSQFPEDIQDYIGSSQLWHHLRNDYYEALEDYNMTNIRQVIENFNRRIKQSVENSFSKFLELFLSANEPGIIIPEKIPENAPAEFKDEAGNLDFYITIKAITSNKEKFKDYYNEIKDAISMYNDLPSSCKSTSKAISGQIDFISSLLWTLYGSLGSHCLTKLIAREEYFDTLLKITFAIPSAKTILLGTRILRHIIPTQHSPQTFLPYWEKIGKLTGNKFDFISFLLIKIGKGAIWYENESSKEISLRWAYEAESLLLSLTAVERWRYEVVEVLIRTLRDGSESLMLGTPLSAIHAGALYFMASSSKNFDGYGVIPTVLSQAKLLNCSLPRGIIKEITSPNARFYSVIEDTTITENLEKIDSIEAQINIKLNEQLDSEEKDRLSASTISFWETLRSSSNVLINANCDSIANLRALYTKLDIISMVCMIDTLESKEPKYSEIENIIGNVISKSKPQLTTSKNSYIRLISEISKKLHSKPASQGEEKKEEEEKPLTEEEAQNKIAQWNDNDQLLAIELVSVDIPIVKIVKCFEMGIKEKQAIIDWKEPEKIQKVAGQIYRLALFKESSFKIKDLTGKSEFYQNETKHLVIKNPKQAAERKEYKNSLPYDIFQKNIEPLASITIMAAIQGQAINNKLSCGLIVGDLEIGITTAIGRPHFAINNEPNGEASLFEPLIIRIYAKANGEVSITNENSKIHVEKICGTVFNGIKIGDFGVYLDIGASASLLCFEVYENKYEGDLQSKIEPPKELEGGERYVKIQLKDQNLDKFRLQLLGFSDEEIDEALKASNDLSSAIDYALNRFGVENMNNPPLSLEQEMVTDIKIFDKIEKVPPGFHIVKIYENGNPIKFEIPKRKILAMKKEKKVSGNACVGFSIAGGAAGYTDIGDLSINDDRTNQVSIKISQPDKNSPSIKDIAFIKVSSVYSVVLPYGYQLLTDKDNKALNIASQDIKSYYILVAVKYPDSVLNCPIVPLKSMEISGTDTHGLVDHKIGENSNGAQVDDSASYEALSLMELYNSLLDIEENRRLAISKKLLVSTLKKYPNMITTMPGRTSLGRLLTHLESELDHLEAPIRKLLQNLDGENFRLKAAKECLNILISYLICNTSGQRSSTYESVHPYADNFDAEGVISFPGANGIRIEFDPRCATEESCDYLKFYEKPSKQGEIKNFSGTGTSKWTGFEVQKSTIYWYFHSDGSRNDWGYRFTATSLGGEKTVKPNGALWMLEKLREFAITNEELRILYTPRFLQPLFLFVLSANSVDDKLRALNILKSYMINNNPTIEKIIEISLLEANELYHENEAAKTWNQILQALITFLFEIGNFSNLENQEQWFMELNELVSDMKGLTDKDEALEMFLFDRFKERISKNAEEVRESLHPYKRQTKVEKIQIPGALFLNIEIDPNSMLDPSETIYFSYDNKGKIPVENVENLVFNQINDCFWMENPKGNGILLENKNRTARRDNGNGYTTAILNQNFNSGIIKITFSIDSDGNNDNFYIGAIKSDEIDSALNSCIGIGYQKESWTWKKSGDFYSKGSNTHGASFSSADLLSILLNFDTKELIFFKNDTEVCKFTQIAEDITPVACFGENSLSVSLKCIQKEGTKYNLTVKGDIVYGWYPINSSYLIKHFWSDSNENASISTDKRTLIKFEDSPSIYATTPELKIGRNYIEVFINSRGKIGLGFTFSSIFAQKLIEHENSIIIYSDVEGFSVNDIIGCYIDFEEGKFKFYKNGKFLVTKRPNFQFNDKMEPLKFVSVLTIPEQSITISEFPKFPADIDIINISSENDYIYYGYKFKIIPKFTGRTKNVINSYFNYASEETKNDWQQNYSQKYKHLFKNGAAEQLVNYLDEFTQSKGLDILNLKNEEINPNENELIYYQELEKISKDDMRELYQILLRFNKRVESSLYLFNLHLDSIASMSELQRVFIGSRSYVFFRFKNGILKDSLTKTANEKRTEITIDRPKAARHRDRKDVDVYGQFSIFGQIYRCMINIPNTEFRNSERVYRVTYRGEASIDAGGPYNESMSNMCDELQSSYLRLLVPCPNNVNNIGENRESWIINPSADSPQDLELFTFLGKLMGAAIRTQNNLNISFPPLFWKRLLMDPLSTRDLRGIDVCTVQILEILRNPEENQLTPETFAYAYDEKFATKDSSGREVELIPNGKEISVTYETAKEYADLIEKFRLSEGAKAYEAIRNGISAVVPIDYLNLFSWKQVETLVCGASNIDIEILKGNTDYENCSINDPHISTFWEVLLEMTPKERSLYLKFVWGRSKLPSGKEWKHMKITRYLPQGPVNNYLPVSHTCFFSIELPAYTSKEVMREKMLYAITHCTDIDLDGRASGGWEEDD